MSLPRTSKPNDREEPRRPHGRSRKPKCPDVRPRQCRAPQPSRVAYAQQAKDQHEPAGQYSNVEPGDREEVCKPRIREVLTHVGVDAAAPGQNERLDHARTRPVEPRDPLRHGFADTEPKCAAVTEHARVMHVEHAAPPILAHRYNRRSRGSVLGRDTKENPTAARLLRMHDRRRGPTTGVGRVPDRHHDGLSTGFPCTSTAVCHLALRGQTGPKANGCRQQYDTPPAVQQRGEQAGNQQQVEWVRWNKHDEADPEASPICDTELNDGWGHRFR